MTDVADFSHERLAAIRTAACRLLDSGVLFIHERTHLAEIIARLDAAVQLKNERAAYQAERNAGPRQTTRTQNGQPKQAAPADTASHPGL
jgi:hypothetical protein